MGVDDLGIKPIHDSQLFQLVAQPRCGQYPARVIQKNIAAGKMNGFKPLQRIPLLRCWDIDSPTLAAFGVNIQIADADVLHLDFQ